MAKSRKARVNARGKRLAAKKSSASLKQESTATTTDQVPPTPNAGPSSSYRMPSSSLSHGVETFEAPTPLGRDLWQHRLEPSTSNHVAELPASRPTLHHQEPASPEHVAELPALQPMLNHQKSHYAVELPVPQPPLHHQEPSGPDRADELPASQPTLHHQEPSTPDRVAALLASLQSTARELHALIESKKTTNTPSRITASDSTFGESVGPAAEPSLKAINPDRFLCPRPDFLDPNFAYNHMGGNTKSAQNNHDVSLDHGFAAPPSGEDHETSDVGMVAACTLGPEIVVGDREDTGLQFQAEQDAVPPTTSQNQPQRPDKIPSSNDGTPHANTIPSPTPSSDRQPTRVLKVNPQAPRSALAIPATPSAPITPVSPTFDVDHASPTSSQSSLSSAPKEENGDGAETISGRGRSGDVNERNKYDRAHHQEKTRSRSAVSHRGRSIEVLGPSIMFELFGGVLE
jgi:hypothetical protein